MEQSPQHLIENAALDVWLSLELCKDFRHRAGIHRMPLRNELKKGDAVWLVATKSNFVAAFGRVHMAELDKTEEFKGSIHKYDRFTVQITSVVAPSLKTPAGLFNTPVKPVDTAIRECNGIVVWKLSRLRRRQCSIEPLPQIHPNETCHLQTRILFMMHNSR